MARTSTADSVTQCDSVATYLEGVHVKIAEAYKPPRKIALPAAYNNKLPNLSKYEYEFRFEKAVLEKMSEWRQVRNSINESRKIHFNAKEKGQERISSSSTSSCKDHLTVKVVPLPETSILTPQPLSPSSSQIQDIKINGLDYSDFDNDTSSPFDNMELKTINDMEELAQVLQPTSHWSHLETEPKKQTTDIEDVIESDGEEEKDVLSEEMVNDDDRDNIQRKEKNQHILTSIITELQKLLQHSTLQDNELLKDTGHVNNVTKNQNCISPQLNSETKLFKLSTDLSEEDRILAKHLSDMGFSLPRTTRAIRDLGGQDDKKIIDYLLALQYLEDAGIPEEAAAKALVLTNYDEDKARQYYENLIILKNFGFPENRASMALLKCDIDRDKALDLLIT